MHYSLLGGRLMISFVSKRLRIGNEFKSVLLGSYLVVIGWAIVRVEAMLSVNQVLIGDRRGNRWKGSTPDLSLLLQCQCLRRLGKHWSVFKVRLFFSAVTSRITVTSLWVGSHGSTMRIERTRFEYLLDSCPTCSFVFKSLISLFNQLLFDVVSLEDFLGLDTGTLSEIACDTANR